MRDKEKQNRFHKAGFNRQILRARSFKREVRLQPRYKVTKFLAGFGIRTWMRLLLSFCVLAVMVYFFLFPNQFWINSIEIDSGKSELSSTVSGIVERELVGRTYGIFPKKHILFLPREKISQNIIKTLPEVKRVVKISFIYPGRMKVVLEIRDEQYTLFNQGRWFGVYSDGYISRAFSNYPVSVNAPFLIYRFKSVQPAAGEQIVNQDELMRLGYMRQYLEQQMNLKVTAAAIGPGPQPAAQESANLLNSSSTDPSTLTASSTAESLPGTKRQKNAFLSLAPSDTVVLVDRGGNESNFFVYLSLTSLLEQQLERLSLLYSQLDEARIKQLSYIDLRYSERAFYCLKESACAVYWDYGF